MSETGFACESVCRIMQQKSPPEKWRVGEAFAETYLTQHRGCSFPWPDSRDERRPKSSLPGADLVGFQVDGEICRFAFGEVKTSTERKYPPTLLYGRSGMTTQLEHLRSSRNTRDCLMRYLFFRQKSLSEKDVSHLRLAGQRYLKIQKTVQFLACSYEMLSHTKTIFVRVWIHSRRTVVPKK